MSKFFVRHFWPPLQRAGIKDPTRAAGNPGICNEVDRTLYNWAKNNTKGIETIIAGHTHRPVYENLSLTEKRYISSGIEIEGIPKKTPDSAYYNAGSCVHPRCITGIEITEGSDHAPAFKLIKWAYSIHSDSDRGTDLESDQAYTDRYTLTVRRTILKGLIAISDLKKFNGYHQF